MIDAEHLKKMRGYIGLDFPVEEMQRLFEHIDELRDVAESVTNVLAAVATALPAGLTGDRAKSKEWLDGVVASARAALSDSKEKP